MKILINEQQVRFLMREFGEGVSDRDTWLEGIYEWTPKPFFEYSLSEIIAYGEDGEYLGYWDDEQGIGFVVTEYIDDEEDDYYFDDEEDGYYDESISPEAMQDLEAFHGDDLLEGRKKSERSKKGKKVPGKYLTKNKSAMKKEIDTYAGTDTYKKQWDADYTSGKGGKGKRYKTKKSAATKAYEKRFKSKE